MMKIMTLCTKCREGIAVAYSVREYALKNSTTQLQRKCEMCHKPYRSSLKLYIVEPRKR